MLRENNLNIYLLIFVFMDLRNITIQDIYKFPVRTLLVYFRNRYLKIFLHVLPPCPLLNTDHKFEKKVPLIVLRHKFYQNLAFGAHFQFSNHDLFEKVVWKLLFENYLLFFIFYFTCCKFFVLFFVFFTVNRPSTFKILLMGRSGCPTKWGDWVEGVFLQA